MSTVIVPGHFKSFHAGHLRQFKYARSIADDVIVFLILDEFESPTSQSVTSRKEQILETGLVQKVLTVKENYKELLMELKPTFVLKGLEFQFISNQEEATLRSYGGQVVFNSGENLSKAESKETDIEILISSISESVNGLQLSKNISKSNLFRLLSTMSSLRVMIIGDSIVDEYIDCDVLGVSQEDKLKIFREASSLRFAGGASIVSINAKQFVRDVKFLSAIGRDESGNFIRERLNAESVTSKLIESSLFQTLHKKRFRSESRTEFRLSAVNLFSLSNQQIEGAIKWLDSELKQIDVLIFSDFNYGLLNKKFVQSVLTIARKRKIYVSADCQISSQFGDLRKYRGVDFMSPTEHEIRSTLMDSVGGIGQLMFNFQNELKLSKLFATIGADGFIAQERSQANFDDSFSAIYMPGIPTSIRDVTGAGDSLLVLSTLAFACGATLPEAALLGAIAATFQISQTGNVAIPKHLIERVIKLL